MSLIWGVKLAKLNLTVCSFLLLRCFFNRTTSSQGHHIFYTGYGIAHQKTDFNYLEDTCVERMRISASGEVGIGESSPSSKLHISNGGIQIDWVSKSMRIDEQHIYSKSGNYGTGFKLRDVDIHPIDGNGASTDGVCDFGTGTYRWRRYAGTYADIFTSDDRVKHNEEEVHNALETINKLKLYKYDKTAKMLDADYQGDLSDVDHLKEVGFIAQDVLEIPELAHLVAVPEDVETTVYGLDYQGINNYLVQAVQELSVTLDSEKMKNEALEARILALENN